MTELFEHQREGVDRIASEPYLWLADEMGAGKTRQVVEAAQVLAASGDIRHVIVAAPAQVYREVWSDPDLGQIAEYSRGPVHVREYRGRQRRWDRPGPGAELWWTVCNYEFIRRSERLRPLLESADRKTALVLDESLAVKSPTSATTRAVAALRKKCGRVVLVNGTEGGGDTPADLYSQCRMMSASVLDCPTFTQYKARYAKMGGYAIPKWEKDPATGKNVRRMEPVQIVGWVNLDELWGRIRPHYLRRLKADCLDLPPKLPPVAVGVALTPETWRLYREMRDDAVARIEAGECTAEQAGVQALRLAQICSGFVGGIRRLDDEGLPVGSPETAEIGREKLDALLGWARTRTDPRFAVWCRFRPEAERAAAALAELMGADRVALLVGGQSREDRQRAVRLLHPDYASDGEAAVVGTTRAGALGLNQAAASAAVYSSNEYSHVVRSQSEDRPHRPGQTRAVSYFDLVASGPDGQRTVDHAIARALRKKQDLARFSAGDWLNAFKEE